MPKTITFYDQRGNLLHTWQDADVPQLHSKVQLPPQGFRTVGEVKHCGPDEAVVMLWDEVKGEGVEGG